ncbi:MAG: hypothetical protein WCO78_00040 [Candidatus Roizmanbacteria bacterium]
MITSRDNGVQTDSQYLVFVLTTIFADMLFLIFGYSAVLNFALQ